MRICSALTIYGLCLFVVCIAAGCHTVEKTVTGAAEGGAEGFSEDAETVRVAGRKTAQAVEKTAKATANAAKTVVDAGVKGVSKTVEGVQESDEWIKENMW